VNASAIRFWLVALRNTNTITETTPIQIVENDGVR
jgi:hypothetical protein